MVADVRVKIVDAGVDAALQRLRQALPLEGSMLPAMQAMGRALKTGVQLRFRATSGPDGQAWEKSFRARTEGGQTLSLSSRLRRSITYDATNTSVAVGTNLQYAAIHQFGGTIRAKNGAFLAIPVTPEARSKRPREMPGLHVAQTLKGQFILVNEKGVTQYLLRRQVTIPARPFLGVSAADRVELLGVAERFYKARWPD
jgi:phage virion morphogenesis protein